MFAGSLQHANSRAVIFKILIKEGSLELSLQNTLPWVLKLPPWAGHLFLPRTCAPISHDALIYIDFIHDTEVGHEHDDG